jgi:DHA1 family tetracycline resistance protein-like MFS transporter
MSAENSQRSALIFIFLTVLIDMIGIGLIIPIMPDLIQSMTDQTVAETAVTGGYLTMAYAATQFIFAPVLGELSDRFGRRPILLLSLFGLGLDYLIHAFSPTITWLFVGRIIAGLFGASHTTAFAYVADISTKENKAKHFGMIGAAFGLGFVIGPGIGGIIGDYFGVKAPFFVAAGFSLLNFLFGYFFVGESLSKEKRRAIDFTKMLPFTWIIHLRKYKAVIWFIAAFGFVQLASLVMPNVWTYYTKERFGWDMTWVGISLVVVGLLVSFVQGFFTGRLVKLLGDRKVIFIGFVLWTIGMLAIGYAYSPVLLYLATIPYVFGGVAGPTIQSLVSNHVSDKEQGNLQGVMTSLGSLSAIFAPILYPELFYYFTEGKSPVYMPGAPFILGAGILVLATLTVVYALSRLQRKENETIIDEELEPSE